MSKLFLLYRFWTLFLSLYINTTKRSFQLHYHMLRLPFYFALVCRTKTYLTLRLDSQLVQTVIEWFSSLSCIFPFKLVWAISQMLVLGQAQTKESPFCYVLILEWFHVILSGDWWWNHVLFNSYFAGRNKVGKATNFVSVHKIYEEIAQISLWYCFKGDRVNPTSTKRSK